MGQFAHDAGNVFVIQHAQYGMRVRKIAHGIKILTQRSRCMRVVGHIQNDSGCSSQYLQASRQLNLGQADAHRLLWYDQLGAQGFQRSQRSGGIQQLIGAAQTGISHAATALATATVSPLLSIARIIEIFAEQDRKSVVEGRSVSVRVKPGGRRCIKKKKPEKTSSK